MGIKKLLLLVLFLFSISLFIPKTSKAVSLQEALTSENSVILKIQEGLQYFFAFTVDKRVGVLENQAEKRLTIAQGYAEEGNEERVQNLLQSYLQIKERQNNLLEKADDGDILGMVGERTIEQQKTMEGIKNKIDDNGKQGVIDVQEQVVNQVAQKIVVQNGTEGQTEFLNEVLHVWAPGTGPGGGEAGVVYAGGGKLIYAPGTGPGGGGVVVVGGQMMFASGTSAGGSGGTNVVEGGGGGGGQVSTPGGQGETGATNTIDPGGLAPGTTLEGENELAP
jgi:hypothetical protein